MRRGRGYALVGGGAFGARRVEAGTRTAERTVPDERGAPQLAEGTFAPGKHPEGYQRYLLRPTPRRAYTVARTSALEFILEREEDQMGVLPFRRPESPARKAEGEQVTTTGPKSSRTCPMPTVSGSDGTVGIGMPASTVKLRSTNITSGEQPHQMPWLRIDIDEMRNPLNIWAGCAGFVMHERDTLRST